MFLLAAEELNFSRAANRAFVTQQCLSDHIKRLENTYHVQLFQRKPKLALTPEGTAMQKYLSKIQLLEEGMAKEISDINAGVRGKINFGIGTTRGEILSPILIPRFQSAFPNVDIQLSLRTTKQLEDMMLHGKLDLFLGVNASQNMFFSRKSICQESLYLVIPETLLIRKYGKYFEDRLIDLKKGIDLRDVSDLPFVQEHESSTITFAILQYLTKYNMDIHIPISVSNFNILLNLCRTGQYATVSSYFHIHHLINENARSDTSERLHVFPLLHLNNKFDIEIITPKNAPSLTLMDTFSIMLSSCIKEVNDEISQYLLIQ